jgi:hypothetical protein
MDDKLKTYISAFKWSRGVPTVIGVSIPAASFFTLYPPPLFEEASLITSAIAAAIAMLTYYYEPRVHPADTEAKKLTRLAATVLGIAVLLLIMYMVMLKVCTVVDPPAKPEVRYQIGFWTFDWSLNADGRYLMQKHANATPWELMDYATAFSKDGPARLWKFWSILVSGVSMIFVFLFTFVLWVFGWSLLAKRKALGP